MELKNLIGHRGFAGMRPENTLSGFSFAAEFGLNMVEYDIQLSKDEHWVLFHDRTLARLLQIPGEISEYTLRELSKFDVGTWFKPPYPGQFIPSLDDAYKLTLMQGLSSNIELKVPPHQAARYAEIFAKFIRNLDPKHPLPLISSFDFECMTRLRKMLPALPIAYLVPEFTNDTVSTALKHDFRRIHCDVNCVTIKDIQQAAEHQIPVYLYTVNSPQHAKLWLSHGAAGFFTDRADLLLQV